MTTYSRVNPSERYRELLDLYRQMHDHGEPARGQPAEHTFSGVSLGPQVHRVKALIERTGAQNVLDYGAGKGQAYDMRNVRLPGQREAVESIQDYWDVDYVQLYDPGYSPHSRLPEGRFDGVICTDVLEHLPEDDLPWILGEIFGYAERFVLLTIACYPAEKHLPNGDNAHVTIRPPEWWEARIRSAAAARPEVLWEAYVDVRSWNGDGSVQRVEHFLTGQGARA